jgi:hypothetical protein
VDAEPAQDGVAVSKEKVLKAHDRQVRDKFVDLQANNEDTIGVTKKLEMARKLLAHDGTLPMCALYLFQTHFETRAEMQWLSRSDDLRTIMICLLFTQFMKMVGPAGSRALAHASKQGKTNTSGRVENGGGLPHANSLFCPVAAMGNCLLFRWGVSGERPPSLANYEDFFTCPLLRSFSDARCGVSYAIQYRIVCDLYENLDIFVSKACHQGRAEGQKELRMLQVSKESISALAHYEKSAQDISYLNDLPQDASFAACGGLDGGDVGGLATQKRFAPAAWIPPMADELLFEAARWLQDMEREVAEKIAGLKPGSKRREFKEARLFSAKGALRALKLGVEFALRAAASRPRDEDSTICYDQLPLYQQFPQNPVYRHLAVFRGPRFAEFAARVKAAEERERAPTRLDPSQLDPLAQAVGAAISPYAKDIRLNANRIVAAAECRLGALAFACEAAGGAAAAGAPGGAAPAGAPAAARADVGGAAAAGVPGGAAPVGVAALVTAE